MTRRGSLAKGGCLREWVEQAPRRSAGHRQKPTQPRRDLFSEVTVPEPAMHPWSGMGASCGDGGPRTPALFTHRGTSATGPNASDHGRAPAGVTLDIERSADGVESIGHALQAGAIVGHAPVEAAAVIADPEL